MKWTRDHKSEDGRFWCYKPPRSDEWQLWDTKDRDENNNAKRYQFRKLADCKRMAQKLVEQGKPLIEVLGEES